MCPARIGLAGFNGTEGSATVATMDACRLEIGRRAAGIIAGRLADPPETGETRITLTPTIEYGDTLRR
jgi:LacI family gluconate utilization system Gnt-I transcriptional repressor